MDENRPMSKNGVLPLAPANRHSDENRPLFDEQGYCHGFVNHVVFIPAHTLDTGCTVADGYCWQFLSPGTLKPYVASYWTGVRWTRESKLLALWNSLGLSRKDPEVDRAIGLPVVFKLERRNDQYQVVPGLTMRDGEHPGQRRVA